MRYFGIGLLLICGASGVIPEARAEVGVCEAYRSAYTLEIQHKIKTGIPFELMSALFVEGDLAYKKVVHISFNLWDEVITVKSGERVLGKFGIKEGVDKLCTYLEVGTQELRTQRKNTFRLLLNPMWSERMTRLSVATGRGLEPKRIIGINWKKFAAEMPSEKVLLEKEISP